MEALKPGSIDGEEVGGEYLGGVLPDELAPGGLATARSRRDAMAAQDPGHMCVGDPEAELECLALHAAIAQAKVLSGEPQDGEAEKHGAGSCPIEPAVHWSAAQRPSYVRRREGRHSN